MPTLHEQRRSVPPSADVDRRVVVAVGPQAACGAHEACLVLAVPTVHGSAGGAGLGGLVRRDREHRAAAHLELAGERRLEGEPADVEDGAVRPALLRDIPSRGVDGAAGHGPDLQVLEDDMGLAPGEIGRRLMAPVRPDARRARIDRRRPAHGRRVMRRSAPTPRRCPLCATVETVEARRARREIEALATGQVGRHRDAAVATDGERRRGRMVDFDPAGEGERPSERGQANRRLADRAMGPGVAIAHPPDLRQAPGGPVAVEPLRLDHARGDGEAVVLAARARRRMSSLAGEELLERAVRRLQRALLGVGADGAHEVELGAQRGQLPCLGDVVAEPAGAFAVAALFKGEVVDKTADVGRLAEEFFLRAGRLQAIDVSAHRHHGVVLSMFYIADNTKTGERAILLGLNAGVSGAGVS